jgi:hypothetical protein
MGNFVAVFNEVNNKNSKFNADRNDNLPFIGTIVAGVAHTSLINGTVFNTQKLSTKKPYWCTEEKVMVTTADGIDKEVWNINVVAELSVIEAMQLEKELGAGKLIVEVADVSVDNQFS